MSRLKLRYVNSNHQANAFVVRRSKGKRLGVTFRVREQHATAEFWQKSIRGVRREDQEATLERGQ
ncbi:hypothetical protein HZS_6375 [Henneguya salminicola]|nr:hypothetical protein HZS_6375 [Henneguya salminicola]